ncbi:hypothetical protein ABEB36_012260 [Hypothenemus hampei]|uniref:ITPR-interacting domain-containing protein n=1 Tax=Hypothenemus hampei TaxID=57062 RepID=A0ABD1ECL8_HYPHA
MSPHPPADIQRRNHGSLIHQWLDSLNLPNQRQTTSPQNQSSISNVYANAQNVLLNRQKQLLRDCSFQSDDSHCSSVESVLELRKPDPEEVLLGLGFGPKKNLKTRIPERFLQPSKLIPQIDINKFLERYDNYSDLTSSVPSSPVKVRSKSN